MQVSGYIQTNKYGKILVLVRSGKHSRYLKLRKSGKDGTHFSDEENHLNEESSILEILVDGGVIKI